MKISIFTPVHQISQKYFLEAYNSLLEQTHSDWEWFLLFNGGAQINEHRHVLSDDRVKYKFLEEDHEANGNVGYLKKILCEEATGEILVEFDVDDLLTPDALFEIIKAFKDPEIVLAYSDFAQFLDDTWKAETFSSHWGWKTYPFSYKDKQLEAMRAFPPSCNIFRRIEYAPNHVRSFRKSAYDHIGGHNKEIKTGDDHDLMCRFYVEYGASRIQHINQCIYVYRCHPNNTCKTDNESIQDQVKINYSNYYEKMALRDAADKNLLAIELGAGLDPREGYITVDLQNAQILADLDEEWPFNNNSVGVIRAFHILEHLKDSIHTMNEAYRVLAPGGVMFIEVPSTDGRGAFQDPTHKTFWNENSFWYYTQKSHARYIWPKYKGRFQKSRVITTYPGKWWKDNECSVVRAELIAIKGDYEQNRAGEILI